MIEAIQQAVREAEQIIVITHVGPDGDAIGSLTAVGLALQQVGKEVDLVCLPSRHRQDSVKASFKKIVRSAYCRGLWR